ncbi:DUF6370 family protein [Pedobacter sp. PWIIR3]
MKAFTYNFISLKNLFVVLLLATATLTAVAQENPKIDSVAFTKPQLVETACGECQFHLKGEDCDLAVRINGKAYFVDGTGIDDHGDAHAKDGFCNSIRKAEVTGKIVDGRFKAISFKLVKNTAVKKKEG